MQKALFRIAGESLIICSVVASLFSARASAEDAGNNNSNTNTYAARWDAHFEKGVLELDVSAGVGYGMAVFGTEEHHHWALGMTELGWMMTDKICTNHWWRGNFEFLIDLFGGAQFQPDTAYFVGMGPELRYNFRTGTRWVPFALIGVGITGTNIRDGDLSTTFEFNLQCGAGVHYFISDGVALTGQYRLIHISNAGLDTPNQGVNSSTFLLGISWFF